MSSPNMIIPAKSLTSSCQNPSDNFHSPVTLGQGIKQNAKAFSEARATPHIPKPRIIPLNADIPKPIGCSSKATQKQSKAVPL
jgi:hypothetical protein